METIVYREMPLGISRVLGVELVGVDLEGESVRSCRRAGIR